MKQLGFYMFPFEVGRNTDTSSRECGERCELIDVGSMLMWPWYSQAFPPEVFNTSQMEVSSHDMESTRTLISWISVEGSQWKPNAQDQRPYNRMVVVVDIVMGIVFEWGDAVLGFLLVLQGHVWIGFLGTSALPKVIDSAQTEARNKAPLGPKFGPQAPLSVTLSGILARVYGCSSSGQVRVPRRPGRMQLACMGCVGL